ncbi:MAG: hypothetical protein ACFB0E_01635 [Leptolyngbyaceae cyanobacterium]
MMMFIKKPNTLLKSLLLAFSFCGIVASSAHTQVASDPIKSREEGAELTFNLLEGADCVVSTSNATSRLVERLETISVDQQVFDSSFHFQASRGNSVTLNCRANEMHGFLSLDLGVPDQIQRYDSVMAVNIYQGGNIIYNYRNLRAGSKIVSVLDLESSEVSINPNSVAIELICSDGYRCELHAIDATLRPPISLTFSSDSEALEYESSRPQPGSTRTDASLEEDLLDTFVDEAQEAIREEFEERVDGILDGLF